MHISGTLSGLSLAAAVFIATLAPNSPNYEASIGLFVFSFLILVATAMQFATTPNLQLEGRSAAHQYLSYITANSSFFLGVALSWLGLRLLLISIHLDDLAGILTWVLLFAILAGAFRLSMQLYRHGGVSGLVCLFIPITGFVFALLYRFVFSEAWSALWPDADASLRLGIVAFAISGLAYLFQTFTLAAHGNSGWEAAVDRFATGYLAGYGQSIVIVIVFVWIAVAQA